jgi:hypothetical protein
MRTIIGYITSAIIGAAAIIGWHAVHEQARPPQHVVQVIERTIEKELDYDRIRTLLIDPTNINPNLEARLATECTYSIAQHTKEPLMGIVLHVDRRWQGDACAALENLLTHGTY